MDKAACLALCALILILGCAQKEEKIKAEKLQVATTAYFLEQFAKGVGGEKIEVVDLLPANADPHLFDPTPAQLARLKDVDVLIYNGAGLEPYAEKIAAYYPHILFVRTTKGIAFDAAAADPHVWLDPNLAEKQVAAIAEAFSAADPQNAEYFRKNAQEYSRKLGELDEKIRNETGNFSKKGYIISHPSFSHFNKRYGLKYYAVLEEFEGDELSAKKFADIVELAKRENITVIYADSNIENRAADAVAKEIGAQIAYLDTMHTKTEFNANRSYFEVMIYNLEQLKRGLG
ncbi:MAG: zinc ABC transporter substrate-binding protein [Candidatus Micrarchaeota archaeon]|nr:zinc ABC transporter substrate-binding protein [Candidatus Micrarchaeota archaeon]